MLLAKLSAVALCLWVVPSPATSTEAEAEKQRQLRGVSDRTSGWHRRVGLTMAVFGDWPYSQVLLDTKSRLIDSVNGDPDVDLVAHLGDIHSGSMPCTGAGYSGPATITGTSDLPSGNTLPVPVVNPGWNTHVFNAFQQFDKPVVYTPGDNEWNDCQKSRQYKSGAPLAELRNLRELFFSVPGRTLGRTEKLVKSQAVFGSTEPDKKFVENVLWHQGFVTFATFNMPGGSNDDSEAAAPWSPPYNDTDAQRSERLARSGANLRWLDAAFDSAARKRSKAVVILMQADMWDPDKGPTSLTNYSPFVQKLAERCLAFGKPVLVLNGDSHAFKKDRPLVSNGAPAAGAYATGCDVADPPACDLSRIHPGVPAVPNLMRIVVKGSAEAGELLWLKLTINPFSSDAGGVFAHENVCYDRCA